MIEGTPEENLSNTQHLLEVNSISQNFRGLTALHNVSVHVDSGEILAIIGPNGAGKTTLLNCITRLYTPSEGSIFFNKIDLLSLPPHKIPSLGIARMFQNVELFKGMSVIDNVLCGRLHLLKYGLFDSFVFFGKAAREEVKHRRRVEEIIDFLEIQHIRKQMIGSLPFGLQKRVELARALAMEPRILLLDEPVAGMNLEETEDMARFILDINEELGITIVLIDHDMSVVMDISDRVIVLNFGQKLADGVPADIYANHAVMEAYLGVTEKNED